MLTLTLIQKIAVWALPVLLAITLHEAAHAFVAYRLGDSTAKMLGRLSLNPIRHIDLIGTIIVPILIGVLSQFNFVFGWAKPVPINENQFKNPRRDIALATAAGPISNFIMAILWAILLKIALSLSASTPALFLALTSQAGILINLILAFLNLLPIPPLDGSRVVASLLPVQSSQQYLKLEPYGFFILIILLATGILGKILTPLIFGTYRFIILIFGL